MRIAVASSSVRERLDRTLAHAGLAFEVTIAGDEVEHGKPAPDMFLLAAERLGVPPAACVVVEDSPPGVAAGHRGRDADARASAGCPESTSRRPTRVVETVTADAILELANQ